MNKCDKATLIKYGYIICLRLKHHSIWGELNYTNRESNNIKNSKATHLFW
jgi:hypothetical protein